MLKIPHHLTGFWLPRYSRDPVATGSIGAGLLLEEAAVEFVGSSTLYNGVHIASDVGVRITSPYPIGYGYAASAVLNIARSIAVVGLDKSAYVTAHVEEVKRLTGLGDVLAIYTGGCLVVRTKPGAPGVGEAFSVRCPKAVLITVDLGRQNTSQMLTERAGALERAGRDAVLTFASEPTFESFLTVARRFSKEVGFLPGWVAEVLKNTPGVLGYFAKKGVVAVAVEVDRWIDVVEKFAGWQTHVTELRDRRVYVSNSSARL